MVTDSKVSEFAQYLDRSKMYSEVDNRSGAHTIRTENPIVDVTRTAPKAKSQTKYRIEVR